MSPIHATVISYIGSMLPAPFILMIVKPIFEYLRRTRFFKEFVKVITEKSLGKSQNIKKYGAYGLLLFVAIPLPGTGVWTGSLIAVL